MPPAAGAADAAGGAAAAGPSPGGGGGEGATAADVLSAGLRESLERHQSEAAAAFDALHASQKHLTASLRRLLNALDDLSALSAPRADGAALEQLRAAGGRARALQAQLRGIAARLDRAEGVLAELRQRRAR